jgi:hypothetical protein
VNPTFLRVKLRQWHMKLLDFAAAALCAAIITLAASLPANALPQGHPALTATATASRSLIKAISPMRITPALTVSCPVGINHYDRTHECWLQAITFVFDNSKGKQVGSTVITLFQYITFRGNALSWSEEDVVTSVKPTGITAPISAELDVSCGASPCTANPSFNPSPIKVGSRGSVSYTDRLSGGRYEKIFNLYILEWSAPGVTVHSDPGWSTPWIYRCDNGVAAPGEGCVTAYTPTLGLSIRQAGASAALFRWAQGHMDEHWGLKGKGKPLTRASQSTAAGNRGRVCDSTFRNSGTVIVHGAENDKDSCDEFPFAATNQSGASQLNAKGEKGTACAQLQSVRTANSGTEAEQWGNVKVVGNPNYSAPCVRGARPLQAEQQHRRLI